MAATQATKLLDYFERYFDLHFPLRKQGRLCIRFHNHVFSFADMVSIPDFDAGAMENWGLVMFRESVLLYNPTTATPDDKLVGIVIVAHELAHQVRTLSPSFDSNFTLQWFGNLVTMGWWDELWLNEGFATYLQFKAAHSIVPKAGIVS